MKKRKDGLYAQQIYLGKTNDKKQYKTVYGRTQKEVKEAIAEIKLKYGKGIDVAAADEPFLIWANRFIVSKEAEGIGFSHLANLKTFREHLLLIHNTSLAKITTADIQIIIDKLALHHNGKKPLSKRTLTGVKQFAGQVFKMAIGARVVDYNPVDYVRVPKTASVTHRTAITEEQQQWIRETPHRAQRASMLMLYAGLRRGEALALTWGDIDFKCRLIKISKSVQYPVNQPVLGHTKSAAGERTVNAPPLLIEYLAHEKTNDRHLYVLHNDNGGMLSESSWRSIWESYMLTLNIKYGYKGEVSKYNPGGTTMLIKTFTPHQLRHTFATLLYSAGVDMLTAKKQMGHEDIETTLGIYSHLEKAKEDASMNVFSEYIGQYHVSNENQ